MGTYRQTRNVEASVIDFLKGHLDLDWTSPTVRVEKSFARVTDFTLPAVCVRVSDSIHTKIEIGSNSTTRTALVLVDIFATGDGQRLDLKDYIIYKIKNGIPYYLYSIENNIVSAKQLFGRLTIMNIADTPVDFNIDRNELSPKDRFRHLLTLTVDLGKVEE